MSDGPVNLNRFRKDKARAEKRARADENAARFGRTRAEKAADEEAAARAARHLEVAAARERGAVPVRLGARILRAETAPIAFAAALLSRLDEEGDWFSMQPRTPFQAYPKRPARY